MLGLVASLMMESDDDEGDLDGGETVERGELGIVQKLLLPEAVGVETQRAHNLT